MYAYRVRFKDLLVEFLPPSKKTGSVAIVCPGAPGVPSSTKLLEFLTKRGFWAFRLRYRGTWESGGKFLEFSPAQDIHLLLDALSHPFTSIWEKKEFFVTPKRVVVFGTSFGGPAALFSSSDSRISKVVTLSGVVDWRVDGKSESLHLLDKVHRLAFGDMYRFAKGKNWMSLSRSGFYNPIQHKEQIDPKKVFMIHAHDDRVVPFASVTSFADELSIARYFPKRGGHFSGSDIMHPKIWKNIRQFLRT